jgi:hypothetical protein
MPAARTPTTTARFSKRPRLGLTAGELRLAVRTLLGQPID